MEHTPIPWRRAEYFGGIVSDSPNEHHDKNYVANCFAAYGGYLVAESACEADADFVCKACNAHDALVVALAVAIVKAALGGDVPDKVLQWAKSILRQIPQDAKSGKLVEGAIRLVGGDV